MSVVFVHNFSIKLAVLYERTPAELAELLHTDAAVPFSTAIVLVDMHQAVLPK